MTQRRAASLDDAESTGTLERLKRARKLLGGVGPECVSRCYG